MEKSRVSVQKPSQQRLLQKSSTLNRRYVKRPVLNTISSPAKSASPDLARRQALAEAINRQKLTELKNRQKLQQSQNLPNQTSIKSTPTTKIHLAPITKNRSNPITRTQLGSPNKTTSSSSDTLLPAAPNPYRSALLPKPAPKTLSAKESKNQAINKAISSISVKQPAKSSTKPKTFKLKKSHNQARGKKIIFALVLSASCVFILSYLIRINLPDISVKVAALHTGIDAAYPTVPKEYQLTSVYSEKKGEITMDFSKENNASFKLIQSKSSWDSNTLLNQFVKPNWDIHYTTLREQGITIYHSSRGAAWVNGGIFYRIDSQNSKLTKQQIKNIATSL